MLKLFTIVLGLAALLCGQEKPVRETPKSAAAQASSDRLRIGASSDVVRIQGVVLLSMNLAILYASASPDSKDQKSQPISQPKRDSRPIALMMAGW